MKRKKQFTCFLSTDEMNMLHGLERWSTLNASDVVRQLIRREFEISKSLTVLEANGALGAAVREKLRVQR